MLRKALGIYEAGEGEKSFKCAKVHIELGKINIIRRAYSEATINL